MLRLEVLIVNTFFTTRSDISVTETITETEIIDPTLTETETETMGFVETDIM